MKRSQDPKRKTKSQGCASRKQPFIRVSQYLELAIQNHQAGNLKKAEDFYRLVLKSDPDHSVALNHLGVVAHQVGKNDVAIQLIRRAILVKPDYADAYNNLGHIMKIRGDLDGASVHFHRAISLKPDYADAYFNLGTTFQLQRRLEEACDSYRRAISLYPEHVMAYVSLGNTLQEQGDNGAAVLCYQKAISITPYHAEAHRFLAYAQRYTEYTDQVKMMRNLCKEPKISNDSKMHLYFGLGKACEDLGNYQQAFRYFCEANRLKREKENYALSEERGIFEKLKQGICLSRLPKEMKLKEQSQIPIFVLGMPRSGTSLVEQILASHPDVFGAGEINTLKEIVINLSGAQSFVGAVEYVVAKQTDAGLFSEIGARYMEKMKEFCEPAKFIVDKMPHNFQLIGIILSALPHAKIIHCVREPIDNCFSIFKNYFVGEHRYAYSLQEIGQYYLLYRDMMRHWHEIYPAHIHDIVYEELVIQQREQTEKLLDFCDLPWDDSCLFFYENSRPVATASAAQVRQPIYQDSVLHWKKYACELEQLRRVLDQ